MPRAKHLCTTPEVMETIANDYFRARLAGDNKHDTDRPPTLVGLARAFGFTSVKAMEEFVSRHEDYEDVYSRAKMEVEDWLVGKASRVDTKNSRGIEFILTNSFKYTNAQVAQVQAAFMYLVEKLSTDIIPKYVDSTLIEDALAATRKAVAEACEQ